MRDVPEFEPKIPLEITLERIIESAGRDGRIPSVPPNNWEDQIINSLRKVRSISINV